MSPKVASILKGQSALSRATSEPLPDNLSGAKHDVDFGKAQFLQPALENLLACQTPGGCRVLHWCLGSHLATAIM